MIKSNKVFLLLMISSFIFAYFQGGNLPYAIFYGFFLVFLIGLYSLVKYSKNLEVKVICKRQIYSAGDNDEFSTIIRNLGFLPAPFVVVKNKALSEINNSYNGDAICLGSDDNRWIKSNVKFNSRGVYNFGEVLIESTDLFNVFKSSKVIIESRPTKVYPKLYEINKLISRGTDIFKNTFSKQTGIEDMYSTTDVRKYREGDNLKRIHWKISAKCSELFVKNYDMVSGEESNIFLDMHENNYSLDNNGVFEELLVDFCASIVNYMQLRGIKSNVFINSSANRNFEIDSREDFNNLMEFFVNQVSDGKEDFVRYVNQHINKIPKLSWIGIITSKVDDKLKDNLITMKDYGYNITVFYCGSGLGQLDNMNILNKIGIECVSCNSILNKAGE